MELINTNILENSELITPNEIIKQLDDKTSNHIKNTRHYKRFK